MTTGSYFAKSKTPLSLNAALYVRIDSFFLLLISHLQNSFDALEFYIQSQKALLSRTQSDVDRLLLREHRSRTKNFDTFDEKVFLIIFDTKLNDNVFISLTSPWSFQDKIDWDRTRCVTTPFSPPCRQQLRSRSHPPSYCRSRTIGNLRRRSLLTHVMRTLVYNHFW